MLFRMRYARGAWLSSIVVLMLQRLPMLRYLADVEFGAGLRAGQILRALIPFAATATAVNTLTGATKFTANPVSPAAANVGQSFTMAFAVTGAPSTTKCYSIDGALPAGLSVPGATVNGTQRTLNASTGSISGTPTAGGSFTVSIRAWENTNRGGNSSPIYSYTINVAGAANVAPAFTTQPASQTVTAGGSATFTVAVSGTPPPTLQWRKGGVALSGQTGTSLTLNGITATDAGSYDCVATNSAGSTTSNAATLTVNAAAIAPAFTTQPASQTVTAGGSATFTVAVSGTPPPTLQWRKAGVALSGQTATSLGLTNVTAAEAGSYDCVATNSAGTATSVPATLTVNPAPAPAAPVISSQPVPMKSKVGGAALFAVQASGTGLTYQWKKNGAEIAGATASTYFLSAVQSGDAGSYTVVVSNGPGSQIESSPATLTVVASGSARLINISTRATVGAVTDVLIPGFVVEGDVSLTILVRAVGPQLAGFGVGGTLADPVMTLFAGPNPIATNDDWEQNSNLAAINAATTTVQAFPLAAGGKDSALLVALNPGVYTVQVSGKNGETGTALVELYAVGP